MLPSDLAALRDNLVEKLKTEFPKKNIIRGFPTAIKVEELPAIYIYLKDITFGSIAFNMYYADVEYDIDFLYEAVTDMDYHKRGYEVEDEIIEDAFKMLKLMYNFAEKLDTAYSNVLQSVTSSLILEREGLYRVMRYSITFKLVSEKE